MAELVAVVCVVESSLFLASEWKTILVEYISPLLKRLGDAHAAPTLVFRLGFVAYGLANTHPSPVIAKRFFAGLPMITKELRDEQHKLGIGQTSSGGNGGMAALEGLVASIEMFDILSDSVKLKPLQSQSLNQAPYVAPRLVSHIIHVAASPPDGTPKPLWNDSPKLDNVTWASLPLELKKRNINFSIINLRPNPQLTELHSSISNKDVSPPWFKIRLQHSVLLTGFPTENKQVSKRPHDNLASPDAKRAKIQQPPVATNPNTNANAMPNKNASLIPTPVSQPSTVSTPQQPAATAQASPSVPRGIMPTAPIMAKYRELEAHVNKLKRDVAAALAQGRTEIATQIKKEHDSSAAALEKFKQVMQAAMRQGQMARPQSGPPPNQTSTAASSIQTAPQAPQIATSATTAIPSTTSQVPPPAQNTQGRAGGPSFPQMSSINSVPNPPIPGQMTPEMASQMQKLVENRGIRPRQASLSQPASTPKLPPPQLPQSMPATGSSQPDASQVWEGSLIWTGFDAATHDRKEIQVQVKVTSLSRADIMPATWPTTLNLTPSREPMAAPADIQSWAKRTKALLCSFTASPRNGDPQINGQNFLSLVQVLTQKRIYAMASWALPSGKITPNVLMFPFNNSLLGAVFPTTGILELPRAGGTPGPPAIQTQNPAQMNPLLAAQFQRLSPEQRSLFLAQMMNQRRNNPQSQQQSQQQQAFQPQTATQAGNFTAPANTGVFPGQATFPTQATHNMMNLMGGSNTANAQMMNMMGAQPSMPHRRTPSGNPVPQAAIGYDVMQSFLQRNADGSGGAGMGS